MMSTILERLESALQKNNVVLLQGREKSIFDPLQPIAFPPVHANVTLKGVPKRGIYTYEDIEHLLLQVRQQACPLLRSKEFTLDGREVVHFTPFMPGLFGYVGWGYLCGYDKIGEWKYHPKKGVSLQLFDEQLRRAYERAPGPLKEMRSSDEEYASPLFRYFKIMIAPDQRYAHKVMGTPEGLMLNPNLVEECRRKSLPFTQRFKELFV